MKKRILGLILAGVLLLSAPAQAMYSTTMEGNDIIKIISYNPTSKLDQIPPLFHALILEPS